MRSIKRYQLIFITLVVVLASQLPILQKPQHVIADASNASEGLLNRVERLENQRNHARIVGAVKYRLDGRKNDSFVVVHKSGIIKEITQVKKPNDFAMHTSWKVDANYPLENAVIVALMTFGDDKFVLKHPVSYSLLKMGDGVYEMSFAHDFPQFDGLTTPIGTDTLFDAIVFEVVTSE